MSIPSNNHHALIVSCHMEVPLIKWNSLTLEETLHHFKSKSESIKKNSKARQEFEVVLQILQSAQANHAHLETLYQENYRIFFVFSFDNLNTAEQFEESVPRESIYRYGLAVDVPMVYNVHFSASSVVATEMNFSKSTKFTNNPQAQKELTEAKNLLNHVAFAFRGIKIETMYQQSNWLRFVFSFECFKDREDFRLSLRSN